MPPLPIGSVAEGHAELHGARHGHTSHGLEGEAGRLVFGLRSPCVVPCIVDFDVVQKENAPAKAVMATGIFLVTVKTEAETAPFRHFIWSEAARVAVSTARLGGRWWCRQRQLLRRWRQSGPGSRRGQKTPRGCPVRRQCQPVSLHQFHLPRKTHGGCQQCWVVDADGVAEGREKTAGEELDPLRFVQAAGTR